MRCGCVSEVRRSVRVVHHFPWGIMNPSKLDSNLIVVDLIEKEEASFKTLTEGVFIEHRQILFALCRWQKSCFWSNRLTHSGSTQSLFCAQWSLELPSRLLPLISDTAPSSLPLPRQQTEKSFHSPAGNSSGDRHWLPIPGSGFKPLFPGTQQGQPVLFWIPLFASPQFLIYPEARWRKSRSWHHLNSLYTVCESAA